MATNTIPHADDSNRTITIHHPEELVKLGVTFVFDSTGCGLCARCAGGIDDPHSITAWVDDDSIECEEWNCASKTDPETGYVPGTRAHELALARK